MEIERINHYKEKLIQTNDIYIEMSKINLSQSKYLFNDFIIEMGENKICMNAKAMRRGHVTKNIIQPKNDMSEM